MGELLITLGVSAALLILAFWIGGSIESSHFRRLAQRELALSAITVSNLKWLPENWRASDGVLVTGEAVIATDYFKVFVAGLRNLFGGRIRAYETLVERARREAIVRMLEQAQAAGANVVWNVRIETATIQGKQQGKSGGVEVIAYGTAMKAWGKE
ncbi:MAG TPA: YbjQ family protein [Thermoguttaceae bacterium]|nr:YbjQ family protein [Thermoguttaceae bacterium]